MTLYKKYIENNQKEFTEFVNEKIPKIFLNNSALTDRIEGTTFSSEKNNYFILLASCLAPIFVLKKINEDRGAVQYQPSKTNELLDVFFQDTSLQKDDAYLGIQKNIIQTLSNYKFQRIPVFTEREFGKFLEELLPGSYYEKIPGEKRIKIFLKINTIEGFTYIFDFNFPSTLDIADNRTILQTIRKVLPADIQAELYTTDGAFIALV